VRSRCTAAPQHRSAAARQHCSTVDPANLAPAPRRGAGYQGITPRNAHGRPELAVICALPGQKSLERGRDHPRKIQEPMRARFGEFIVDFETRQLLRDAHPVHLTPKAYQLLVLLVEAQPRALSKDELQQGLWPSTFVDEANLSVVVAELRSALGDDARQPRYVRTVHGFGYAFAATVARDQPTTPPGSLRGGAWWLHSESTHAKLQEGENAVGRELPTDVWLDSGSVSRRHAKIVVEGMTAWLEDLGSKNGTTVNGQKVTTRVKLSDGDEVRFGAVLMRLRWAVAAGSTETLGGM
jgi:DNA-binding winged helix-turn-helix (wHTH) protein